MLRHTIHPLIRRLALCLLLIFAPVVDAVACCCKLSAQSAPLVTKPSTGVSGATCCRSQRSSSPAPTCCASTPQPKPQPKPFEGCCRKAITTCECCDLATPFRPGSRATIQGYGSLQTAVLAAEVCAPRLLFAAWQTQPAEAAGSPHGNRRQAVLCTWRN